MSPQYAALLAPWEGPHGLPRFDLIADADFAPAIDIGLTEARAAVAAIVASPDAPTLRNTIAALELADLALDRALSVFWTLAGADSTPLRQGLEREFAPLLSEFGSEITANKALFARIQTLWETRETLNLTPEEARVLLLTRRDLVRAGAELTGPAEARMTEVKARLAVLGTQFSQNVLADERDWSMPLTDADLARLPDFVVQSARAAGQARGAGGPVVTLSRSLIVPFLQFSPHRALRQRACEAWVARGANGGATDNRAIATEMLALRDERARLLGYANFAAYKLETEMAGDVGRVRDLLMQVWSPARAAALEDQATLEAMLLADGQAAPLEAWDWRYYAERRRLALHDLDEAELKPYFQLDRMIDAAFACANRLFGLEFQAFDAATYHPDVRLWQVTRGGAPLAVFIGDFYARDGKHSGAWCSALQVQSRLDGDKLPLVINVCNFAAPSNGAPALLSFDDARTLFHEFGHALHQMLSNVTFKSISGTSVARDFVELPSQLYEHWLSVPEVLAEFATHAETGQPMPAALRTRLLGAQTYDMGFQTVEYVASALVDLAFHDGPPPADPMQRQAEVLESLGMPRAIRMRHATPHFNHVFSGDGYSAGYYSYMWSEVMDADAFAAFEEAGDPFDTGLAQRLEQHILSAGGSEDAAALYTRFRGRMPGVAALLKGRGFPLAA